MSGERGGGEGWGEEWRSDDVASTRGCLIFSGGSCAALFPPGPGPRALSPFLLLKKAKKKTKRITTKTTTTTETYHSSSNDNSSSRCSQSSTEWYLDFQEPIMGNTPRGRFTSERRPRLASLQKSLKGNSGSALLREQQRETKKTGKTWEVGGVESVW